MKTMKIPKGWRPLSKNENVQKGDKFWSISLETWVLSDNNPGSQSYFTYIRKAPKVAPTKLSPVNVVRINRAFNRMANALDRFAGICKRNGSPIRHLAFSHPISGSPTSKLSVRYKGFKTATQRRPVFA